MSRCDGCTASTHIGSSGDPDAPFCIVGEAPGAQELLVGRPFVGESGSLLNRALEQTSLKRDEAFITNALNCRILSPSKEQLLVCQPRLLEETKNARFIMALGNSALRSLTGNFNASISRLRGTPIQQGSQTIFPTYHPAAVLRNRTLYSIFMEDIQRAVDTFLGQERKVEETEWQRAEATNNLLNLYQQLPRGTVIGADIETTSLDPRNGKVVAVGLSHTPGHAVIFGNTEAGIFLTLKEILTMDHLRFVWHNGKFDVGFLKNAVCDARIDEDSMLLHYILAPSDDQGLKTLAARYLGVHDYEADVAIYKKTAWVGCPPGLMERYLAKDCDYTLRLFQSLWPRLSESQLWCYEKVLIPASGLLVDIEAHGIRVDLDRLYRLRESYLKKQGETLAKTQSLTNDPTFNPNSHKQVLRAFHELNVPLSDTTRSTMEFVAAEYQEGPVSELAWSVIDYHHRSKMISTYFNGVESRLDSQDRVHSNYKIHGTVTGRLSSTDPNLQNIPKESDIKQIFCAAPGSLLVSLDYSQAELRVLAAMSHDEFLTECFMEGRDLHSEMALAIFGPNFDSFQRRVAKVINFAIVYGAGPAQVARTCGVSLSEAKEIVEMWAKRAPKAWGYLRACRSVVQLHGKLRTPFGRERSFQFVPDNQKKNAENEAGNFPIQSIASDFCLVSAIKLNQVHQSYIVNLVHDEILLEQEESIAEEVGNKGKEIMESTPWLTLGWKIPFPVDLKLSKTWGEA